MKVILAALFAIVLALPAWAGDACIGERTLGCIVPQASNSLNPLTQPKPGDVCVVRGDGTMTCSTPGAAIVGQARVIDGDTIEVSGQRIRLFGIDAPERAQTCESDAGVYECGRDATATMTALLRNRSVSCEPKDRDRYGRIVAVCSTEAGDIGAAMVKSGWAIVYRRYAKGAYEAEEAAAKAEKLGLWSGRFEMPADWRRRHAHDRR